MDSFLSKGDIQSSAEEIKLVAYATANAIDEPIGCLLKTGKGIPDRIESSVTMGIFGETVSPRMPVTFVDESLVILLYPRNGLGHNSGKCPRWRRVGRVSNLDKESEPRPLAPTTRIKSVHPKVFSPGDKIRIVLQNPTIAN